jgi:SsrA-binding protein
LTKREIRKLENAIMQKGYTLVPLKVYLSNQLAKVELAIAKGKKLYDRREDLKKESADREIRKNMKDRNERYY